jgi:hypothetical protein
MKSRSRAILGAILSMAVSASIAGSSQAFLAAGWDFSQYSGDALLSIDAINFTTTLSANYSDLDPTFGAGAESAAFGTLYLNGSFGSSSVTPTGNNDEAFLPTAGSLQSNLDVPLPSFDAFTVLLFEGQLLFNPLSMTAQDAVSIVFRVDLSSVPETGGNWSLSFAGKTFSGTSMVGIDFSIDGSGYANAGSVMLDDSDAQYIVNLGTAASETAFVRFNFNPVGVAQPIIDNVAISAPEPGAIAQSFAAVLGLLVSVRIRGRFSRGR